MTAPTKSKTPQSRKRLCAARETAISISTFPTPAIPKSRSLENKIDGIRDSVMSVVVAHVPTPVFNYDISSPETDVDPEVAVIFFDTGNFNVDIREDVLIIVNNIAVKLIDHCIADDFKLSLS